jgi:hypothetical protein
LLVLENRSRSPENWNFDMGEKLTLYPKVHRACNANPLTTLGLSSNRAVAAAAASCYLETAKWEVTLQSVRQLQQTGQVDIQGRP